MSNNYSSYSTTTTTYTSAKRIKWETELLMKAQTRFVAEKYATTKVVGKGEAGTVRFNRVLRPALQTSADSEGYGYTYADAKKLTSNYIDVTPESWGDSFLFTDDVSIEAFITDADNQNEIADQMARSLEKQILKKIATQCLRHRIDKDATYQVSGTCDSSTTTTALIDNALTQIDDFWNGGYVTITNPEGGAYDETSAVTDFTASSDTAEVSFTNTPTAAVSNYRMTVGTGLAATDVLTTSAILDTAWLHQLMNTEKFPGGLLRGFIHPNQEHDLFTDTDYKAFAQYSAPGRYSNYTLVRWLGHEFVICDLLHRETTAGSASATGTVYVSPIFGQKAYAIWRWGMGKGAYGVEWVYKDQADSLDLRNKLKAISWKSKWAGKVLRSTSVIGLMTGATDPAILV